MCFQDDIFGSALVSASACRKIQNTIEVTIHQKVVLNRVKMSKLQRHKITLQSN